MRLIIILRNERHEFVVDDSLSRMLYYFFHCIDHLFVHIIVSLFQSRCDVVAESETSRYSRGKCAADTMTLPSLGVVRGEEMTIIFLLKHSRQQYFGMF